MSIGDDLEQSLPKPITSNPEGRRRSFLEIGGSNSISNFASSYRRVNEHLEHRLEDELDITNEERQSSATPLLAENYRGSDIFRGSDSPFLHQYSSDTAINEDSDHSSYSNYGSGDNQIAGNVSDSPRKPIRTNSAKSLRSQTNSITRISGSTAPQTIFNSVNTLMGIGMLSLPYALKLSGWIFGSTFFLVSAILTNFTAKIIARILKDNSNLHNYGDLARFSFGKKIQFVITIIFSADLIGATVSLILLFGDSFEILSNGKVSGPVFKTIMVCTIFISSFLPLSVLSFSSLIGIFGVAGIIFIVFAVGIHSGSLLGNFAPTHLWPQSLGELLLSIGIYMAPWGGHVVFPELYRDMRHPQKFNKCANISFSFTFLMNFIIASSVYLMYGDNCKDAFTKNLMNTGFDALSQNTSSSKFFKNWIPFIIALLMGTLSIVKAPLLVRPVFSVLEKGFEIDTINTKPYSFKRLIIRIGYCTFLLGLSLVISSFGILMALLGSAVCFTICIIMPLMFYDKLYEVRFRSLLRLGIGISIVTAIFGTLAVLQ